MVLRGKRPVSQASAARMQRVAMNKIQKKMKGNGLATDLAKIVGPPLLKEAIKIGSAIAQKQISKPKKRKRGKGLRPAGAMPSGRRKTAPQMPRPRKG